MTTPLLPPTSMGVPRLEIFSHPDGIRREQNTGWESGLE